MTTILQRDNVALRKKSVEVAIPDITKPTLARILRAMKTALDEQEDGVAIAAPQIGENLRIFVVSEKVFELSEDVHERREKQKQLETKNYKHLVFINPVLTKLSRQKKLLEEGCLSVRWFYGKVKRSIKATVKAYDEHGVCFERGASGLLAQVFQHEIDHLEGILFIDKAEDVREMQPEKAGL
ncbi:MAG TPA: peptide deformylase [Candidatus Paceibacterota bacterium]